MADDAGALLVRSGLVSSSALDDARTLATARGGTLGEQLVASGAVDDDTLTDFYRQRLLVPQVNPNTLARLPAKIVALIPSDMAVELRAIPVSLDENNNLTVAMSDPSDRHAVDEIAFFTGAYVVRAVATQMQIAWCLAHYYGHVTALGERLLQRTPAATAPPPDQAPRPRTRGVTGKVEASRHRAIVPGASLDVARPLGAVLDGGGTVKDPDPEEGTDDGVPRAPQPRARSVSGEIRLPVRRAASIKPPLPEDESGPTISIVTDEPSAPIVTIEVDEPSAPVIIIEASEPSAPVTKPDVNSADAPTDRTRPAPRRSRPAEPDPPELAARAGEVQSKTGPIRAVRPEEPRVVIDVALEDDEDGRQPTSPLEASIEISGEISSEIVGQVSGEIHVRAGGDRPQAPKVSVQIDDQPSAPVIIQENLDAESQPILLERRRASDAPANAAVGSAEPAEDGEVVMLQPKGRPRRERRTEVGIGPLPAATQARLDFSTAAPEAVDDEPTGSRSAIDLDATRLDAHAVPPGDYTTSDEILAAPPDPTRDDDTSPHIVPPPRGAPTPQPGGPPPSGQVRLDRVQRAPSRLDDDDDDDDRDGSRSGRATEVMSALELDAVIPGRRAEVVPAHLDRGAPRAQAPAPDGGDDGWGPPGTTIPPALLGAIPGSMTPPGGNIPLPSLDAAPLMVAPPAPPELADKPAAASDAGVARALEDAATRILDLIHSLELTEDRDEVIAVMIAHLGESHRRAGFFTVRGGEMQVFAISPRPAVLPIATLRLDRPSTLADVVGTRLPYRGPMHDDASRTFLTSVLGACPPELLLVPIAVRERVVGVLFGEHRLRHTFDDQLALAARAAGDALERVLKAKRG